MAKENNIRGNAVIVVKWTDSYGRPVVKITRKGRTITRLVHSDPSWMLSEE